MHKFVLLTIFILRCTSSSAQLFIAPGDSISVLPGTLFTLQENLVNNGKIYNGGVLTLNGSSLQSINGTGNINNLTADNNVVLLHDLLVDNNLLINPGKTIDLGNFTLNNTGSVNGTGMLRGSPNATVNLIGSGTSNINFDQSNNTLSNALKNMEVSNGDVVFQNKLYVYDALLPSSGTITLNDELVLRSNSITTARVGITGSAIVYGSNGKFVIERYIPGRRAWRLLTAPVTTASNLTISDAWQDGKPRVTNINVISNPEPGFGTHVTFGLPATNGYDQGINGNTSIRYLNSTGWNGVSSATNNGSVANSGIITDQPGYMLFVRGDRGTLLAQATGAVTSPTVLRPAGKINTGYIKMPLSVAFNNAGSSFRVVSNPYPSAINFHSIVSNPANVAKGFADAFYLWDPNITGSNGVGGFVGLTYNAAASLLAGKPVYDFSVPSSINDNGDIQSGSAFVIDYAGIATDLDVDETNKSTQSNNNFFRPVRQLQTTLLAENADGSTSINDGALISVDENNSNETDKADLKKLGNFAENISIIKNGSYLCIEKRQPLSANDTVCYFIKSLRQKKYELKLTLDEGTIENGTGLFLEDQFAKTQTALQLHQPNHYAFRVTTDTASSNSYRFRLICRKVNQLINLQAQLAEGNVLLHWNVADSSGSCTFTIERSTDSSHFYPAGTTAVNTFTDLHPAAGYYFYRVKCVNDKGVISYSTVIKITVPFTTPGFSIYPNPVQGQRVMLQHTNTEMGMYHVRLLDQQGKMIRSYSFNHAGGMLQQHLVFDATLSNGTYHLEVLAPGEKAAVIAVLVKH